MKTHHLSRIAGALILALGLSTSAMANDTTSGIRGKIVGPKGNVAANTKITITYQPTGSTREVVTNNAGVFAIKGLRVGGPYTIVIDSDKFQDTTENNISLNIGETYRLNVQLEPKQQVETITVTGNYSGFDRTGSNSSYGTEEIANAPSFNRDLKDIVRNNPLAVVGPGGTLSIGGMNPRYNSITVDGIGQNDDFGLNGSGYVADRSPISIDAVEQVSISVAPFDAKLGGFSGGLVNAVTKSGTNEFHGTATYEFQNASMAGTPKQKDLPKVLAGDEQKPAGNFTMPKDRTAAFTLGGPLVKDELFFFTSYEDWKRTEAPNFNVAGHGANTSDVTQADVDSFINILDTRYGYKDKLIDNLNKDDKKFLLKLDWDINEDHRADFTYQYQDANSERGGSTDARTLKLDSSVYTIHTKNNNFAAHLFSDWSDDFSTAISTSYKNTQIDSLTRSDLGAVSVDRLTNSSKITAGTDVYRHANAASTKTFKLEFDGTYLYEDHEIEFGYHFQALNLYNLFGAKSKGDFTFRTLANFDAGKLRYFNYDNAFTNNVDDLAYNYKLQNHTFYIQDTLSLTDDLEVTAGVRYELTTSNDRPKFNEQFTAANGFTNQNNLDGTNIILPRLGFTYYLTEDTKIRGGIGRFSGGKPNVWLGNSFTNDGVTLVQLPYAGQNAVKDTVITDLTKVPEVAFGFMQAGNGNVNYIDPNYKFSSDWRYQLGLDTILDIPYAGEGFAWSIEVNYTKHKDANFWKDTSRVLSGKTDAPGGHGIYKSIYEGTKFAERTELYEIALTNIDNGGHTFNINTSLNKKWDNGINMSASYSYQDVNTANGGTSSRAVSNIRHNISMNMNEALIGPGPSEVEHRFVLNLGYKTEFFEGYATDFDIFFERRSGTPLSYTLGLYRDTDFGQPANDLSKLDGYLAYIPSGPDDPNMDWEGSRLTWDEASQIIDALGLGEYKGGYAPKGGSKTPWVTKMDLSISQELPGFYKDQKGLLFLTVDNFANLLNSNWGQVYTSYAQRSIFDLRGLDANGRYQLEKPYGAVHMDNWKDFRYKESTWRVKVGVKYSF